MRVVEQNEVDVHGGFQCSDVQARIKPTSNSHQVELKTEVGPRPTRQIARPKNCMLDATSIGPQTKARYQIGVARNV